jgi:tetratricopeptide (TPR) repeat protein
VWFYLGKLLWPLDLCFIYRRWKIDDGDVLAYLPGLLLLLIVFALALWRRRTWGRPVVMLIVCYVALLLPALGFVKIAFMEWSLVADHWQYAATIVPCAVLGAVAAWTCRQLGCRPVRLAVYALGLALLAILAGLTRLQTRAYADIETFWNDTLAKNPNCWPGHNNLGVLLASRGRVDEAIVHYRKCIEVKPDDFEAHYNLGNALVMRGRVDEAIAHYRMALEFKPGYFEARNNLGHALVSQGQVDEGIAEFWKVLELKPDSVEAHYNLGVAFAGRGQVDDAISHYRKALGIKPEYAEAHYSLAIAFTGRRQFDMAIDHYRKAVEIKPDYAEAHVNLGVVLAGQKRFDEAIAQYLKVLEFKPDLLEAHYNLGLALAGCGRPNEALEHFQKAFDLASARNDPGLANTIRAKMKLAGKVN